MQERRRTRPNSSIILLASVVLAGCLVANQAWAVQYKCNRSWYVGPRGNDHATGTSRSPFKTINRATHESSLRGGDCIKVLPGTYRETVYMPKGGNANDPAGFVALQATSRRAARIHGPGNATVVKVEASYVIIDGLDVSGGGTEHCIEAGSGRSGKPVHHISAQGNAVHDCGGSGISMTYGDWYWITGNTSYRNARSNRYQTSGISIYEPRAVAFKATRADRRAAYHIIVSSNVAHDNRETFGCGGCHTDGNGIIIDDFQNSQGSGRNYPFRTLVANNVAYGNGGRGVHINHSDHVTVTGNRTYGNNQDTANSATWRGEITAEFSSNNRFERNIAYAVPRGGDVRRYNVALNDASAGGYVNRGNVWINNVAFDGTPGHRSAMIPRDSSATRLEAGRNLLGFDPHYVHPPANLSLKKPIPWK